MVSGMRQVGKSTLLKQLSSDKRTIISFDDINNLESAKNAPLQFLQLNPPPCFFNQVQRVPEIFKALKISVDSRSEKGLYWLSGSQKLSLMSQVSDALPGRLMNFELWPFSIYEIAGKGLEQKPYLPSFSLSSNLPILHAHGKYSCVEIKSKTSPDTHDAKWLNKAEDLLPDLAENASIVCMTEKAFPISPSIVAHSIWQI